jgi:PhnB protein
MKMQIQPYIFLGGRCEEALQFYSDKLGAKIQFMMRFKEAPPDPNHPVAPGMEDKIMHATLQIGDSILMMSDGNIAEEPKRHSGFSLSIPVETAAEGEKLFDALAEGGQIAMPYQKTFWTEGFGMLTDKFGIPWMVNVAHAEREA